MRLKRNAVKRNAVIRHAAIRHAAIRNAVKSVAVKRVAETRNAVTAVAVKRHAVKRGAVKRCVIERPREYLASALDRRGELGVCHVFRLVRSPGYQRGRYTWTCRSLAKRSSRRPVHLS
ncbi:hypothetical protein MTO96_006963 [Rhipicephalus appendiculatus]